MHSSKAARRGRPTLSWPEQLPAQVMWSSWRQPCSPSHQRHPGAASTRLKPAEISIKEDACVVNVKERDLSVGKRGKDMRGSNKKQRVLPNRSPTASVSKPTALGWWMSYIVNGLFSIRRNFCLAAVESINRCQFETGFPLCALAWVAFWNCSAVHTQESNKTNLAMPHFWPPLASLSFPRPLILQIMCDNIQFDV